MEQLGAVAGLDLLLIMVWLCSFRRSDDMISAQHRQSFFKPGNNTAGQSITPATTLSTTPYEEHHVQCPTPKHTPAMLQNAQHSPAFKPKIRCSALRTRLPSFARAATSECRFRRRSSVELIDPASPSETVDNTKHPACALDSSAAPINWPRRPAIVRLRLRWWCLDFAQSQGFTASHHWPSAVALLREAESVVSEP